MRRSIKRILAAAIIGLPLSGCATLGGGGDMLQINTDPPGALVTVANGASCETPCSIKLDGPRRATIAKAGFVSLDVMLSPSRRAVTVPLELAAASEDVDAVTLPDIN